jgi:hypothetical protein
MPEYLMIKGSRQVIEEDLTEWELVGQEIKANGSIVKPINQLSYMPGSGTVAQWAASMFGKFSDIASDEGKKLAEECIFKWYRWAPASNRENRLPWLDMRAKPKEDIVEGTGLTQRADPLLHANYYDSSKWSPSVKEWTDVDITDGWTIDREKGIVKFQAAKYKRISGSLPGIDPANVAMADIVFTIAYELKDNNNEEDFYYHVWPPTWASNCELAVEQMPELVLYARKVGAAIDTYYNLSELDTYCENLQALIEKKYASGLTGQGKTLIGILARNCDGAITSVQWRAGKDGAYTAMQSGRDKPPVFMPTYKEFQIRSKQTRIQRQSENVTADIGRKIAETRTGASTRDSTSKPTEVPIRSRGELLLKNTHGTSGPIGGFGEITGYEDSSGAQLITRPTGDNKQNVVIIKNAIAPGGYGIGSESATDYITTTGAALAIGDRVGSKSGQWEGEKAAGGSHLVTAISSGGEVFAAKQGGSGGVHFCQIISGVLKKRDPHTGALATFEKSLTEVYEGVTGNTLAAANYPDLTFLVVYVDSSGIYFAHPFAAWRPYSV